MVNMLRFLGFLRYVLLSTRMIDFPFPSRSLVQCGYLYFYAEKGDMMLWLHSILPFLNDSFRVLVKFFFGFLQKSQSYSISS